MSITRVFLFLFLFQSFYSTAQVAIPDGSFEQWTGGYFRPGEGCCGPALAVPVGWGIPEQLMAMAINQFVYRESDSTHIHSGSYSAKLWTNVTELDSAGDVADNVSVSVPGAVSCAGIVGIGALGMTGDLYKTMAYSKGIPYSDTPSVLYFYMMFDHMALDTARYAYAFTRWDSIAMREDTLAMNDVDLPDDTYDMDQWLLFTDTIHYRMAGVPDTLHLIFFGGRNADSTLVGNITWVDDVSFYHSNASDTTASGIIHLDPDDAVSVYPSPASQRLHVTADKYMTGYTFELYDLTGRRVLHQPLSGIASNFDISSLSTGVYLYRLLDHESGLVTSGKATISQ